LTQWGASGSPRAIAFPWSDLVYRSCSVEWQVPHFTGKGFSCGKSFPSRSAWHPVQPKLAWTEPANFLGSTNSETVLPPRVVVVLLSPWHARHSAPGWSAARTGRAEKRRDSIVARSVTTTTPTPLRHFLRRILSSVMFNSS